MCIQPMIMGKAFKLQSEITKRIPVWTRSKVIPHNERMSLSQFLNPYEEYGVLDVSIDY